MIVYIIDPKTSTTELLPLKNMISKVARYKINRINQYPIYPLLKVQIGWELCKGNNTLHNSHKYYKISCCESNQASEKIFYMTRTSNP